MERGFDKDRLIADQLRFHIAWQRRLNFREAILYCVGNGDGVLT